MTPPGCEGFFICMAAFSVIVFKVDFLDGNSARLERESVVPRDRHAPRAFAVPLQGMQLPSRKERNLVDALRLLDGRQHGPELLDLLGRHPAGIIVSPEAFEALMPKGRKAHDRMYGTTVRLSKHYLGSMHSEPRLIATTPVRETSTKPSGSIRLTNWSILSE